MQIVPHSLRFAWTHAPAWILPALLASCATSPPPLRYSRQELESSALGVCRFEIVDTSRYKGGLAPSLGSGDKIDLIRAHMVRELARNFHDFTNLQKSVPVAKDCGIPPDAIPDLFAKGGGDSLPALAPQATGGARFLLFIDSLKVINRKFIQAKECHGGMMASAQFPGAQVCVGVSNPGPKECITFTGRFAIADASRSAVVHRGNLATTGCGEDSEKLSTTNPWDLAAHHMALDLTARTPFAMEMVEASSFQ